MTLAVRVASHVGEKAKNVLLTVDQYVYHGLVAPLAAFLPAQLAYGVALFRSDLRYQLQGSYRRQIKYSLEFLFGDRFSDKQRDQVVRDYFRSKSCETIDAMRMLGRGKSLLELVEVRGLEHLDAALASGKGAILCGAHFGSPKSCFSLIGALGFPVTAVARWSYGNEPTRKLKKLFYRLEHDYPASSHFSRPNIERWGERNILTAAQAAAVLRRNEFVAIMIDSEVKPGDTSKPMVFSFLGRKTILVPGATTIAQVTGAPAIVVLLHRTSDWRHQILEVFPSIHVERDPLVAFRQCLSFVEEAIKRYPSQWKFLPYNERKFLPINEEEYTPSAASRPAGSDVT